MCEALRQVFATFGVPDDLSSDGGPEFTAMETEDFLNRWGVNHTLSSAYFPQSNGRAEVAVRITKRLLEDHVGAGGSLNNDNIVRALLQLRNTPDRECQLSPAEVLFGHQLKDAMPKLNKSVPIFDSPQLHLNWRDAWESKEKAIRTRMVKTCERLDQNSKDLPPLREGDTVFIQNQNQAYGKPNKCDREGTIVEVGNNNQYVVRVHGTGRLTIRNRRFLRRFAQRGLALEADSMPYKTPPSASTQSADEPALLEGSDGDQKGDSPTRDDATDQPDNVIPRQPELSPVAQPEWTSTSRNVNHNPSGTSLPPPVQEQSVVPGPPILQLPVSTRGPGRPCRRRKFNFMKRVTLNEMPLTRREHPRTSISKPPRSFADPSSPEDPGHLQTRRSSRAPPQRLVYDASTGEYVAPHSKKEQ